MQALRRCSGQARQAAGRRIFFDVSKYVHDVIYTPCKAEFPDVHFVELPGGSGREPNHRDFNCPIQWSDDLLDPTEIGGGHPAYLPQCVTNADYIINVGALKGYTTAGMTVYAKNHFGSFVAVPAPGGKTTQIPKNAGIHPHVATHDFTWPNPEQLFLKRAMGTYNVLVDLMGHEELGEKTMLYMIDGLYSSWMQNCLIAAPSFHEGL